MKKTKIMVWLLSATMVFSGCASMNNTAKGSLLGGGGGAAIMVDTSMAHTQNEAYEIIASYLMKQGMTNGSKEFDEAMQKIWADNNIKSLPVQ